MSPHDYIPIPIPLKWTKIGSLSTFNTGKNPLLCGPLYSSPNLTDQQNSSLPPTFKIQNPVIKKVNFNEEAPISHLILFNLIRHQFRVLEILCFSKALLQFVVSCNDFLGRTDLYVEKHCILNITTFWQIRDADSQSTRRFVHLSFLFNWVVRHWRFSSSVSYLIPFFCVCG